jgi:hypothetical protein
MVGGGLLAAGALAGGGVYMASQNPEMMASAGGVMGAMGDGLGDAVGGIGDGIGDGFNAIADLGVLDQASDAVGGAVESVSGMLGSLF